MENQRGGPLNPMDNLENYHLDPEGKPIGYKFNKAKHQMGPEDPHNILGYNPEWGIDATEDFKKEYGPPKHTNEYNPDGTINFQHPKSMYEGEAYKKGSSGPKYQLQIKCDTKNYKAGE